MPEQSIRFLVRTPHKTVIEIHAKSVRLPTETGQVGLRPYTEATVIGVEAGLVLVQSAENQTRFVGTAGGLLTSERLEATLLTPLAVVGNDYGAILAELKSAIGEPNEEMQAREMLANLEEKILTEIRRGRREETGLERSAR